jgi:hypothetical protein
MFILLDFVVILLIFMFITGSSFALHGTHRVVFGWVPPAGIPFNVLERLRDALLDSYALMCREELDVRRSGQTSPVSPTTFGVPLEDAESMFDS